MSEEEREAFLLNFMPNPEKTTLGFLVIGGAFGEGIDLVSDRLIGAIIIGIGLPKLNFQSNKIAEYFVENRNQKKGESIKKLKLELSKKGIDQDIIDQTLANSDRNDEEEIKKIIAKKAKRYDAEKLISYLMRQGFDYQLSKDLVQEQMPHQLETD